MPSSRRRSTAPKALTRALGALFSIQADLERRARMAAKVLEQVRDKALYGACGWESEVALWAALLRDCPCLETLLRIEEPTPANSTEPLPETAPYGNIESTVHPSPSSCAQIRPRSCAGEHRKPAAFAAVAAARARLLELETAVVERCMQARMILEHIEGDRLHLECGYESFEDLLERALGPNPAFSTLLHRASAIPSRAAQAQSSSSVYNMAGSAAPSVPQAERSGPPSVVLQAAAQFTAARAWAEAQDGASDLSKSQAASLFLAPPRVPADMKPGAERTIPAPAPRGVIEDFPSTAVDLSELSDSAQAHTQRTSERPIHARSQSHSHSHSQSQLGSPSQSHQQAPSHSQVQKVAERIHTPTQADGLIALVAERERDSSVPAAPVSSAVGAVSPMQRPWVRAGVAAAVAALAGASLAFRP